MSQPTDLAANWPAINALLDEALSLPPARRADWLDALPEESQPIIDTLRRLLALPAAFETGDILHTLPKLLLGPDEALTGVPAEGTQVGPWRLLREIGEGGMGSVWLAERIDGQLKRQVALKLPRLSWVRGLAERMARERDILATLDHPHIARLYDAGVDQHSRPWLALEYVQGLPLDRHCQERGLDVSERLTLLLQVCEAMAYAHGRLVIHRDLKPANILVTEEGQVKLLDFGIARLLKSDAAAGQTTALTQRVGAALTPGYASPEQLRGELLTTASDVYSLGVVAYEFLCGTRPVPADDGECLLASRAAADARFRLALQGDLDAVLRQALAQDAAKRYGSIERFADDLRAVRDSRPVQARLRGPAERALGLGRKHARTAGAGLTLVAGLGLALGVGATALVAAVALAGAALTAWQARRAQQGRRSAEAEQRRAELVRDCLMEIFNVGGVARPGGRRADEVTLKEVLDIARARITERLAPTPRDRAQVLKMLSGVYQLLEQPATEFELLDQALADTARLQPPDDLLRAELLLRRTVTGFLHQRFDGMQEVLDELDLMLRSQPERLAEHRPAAAYLRLRLERQNGRYADDMDRLVQRCLDIERLYVRLAPAAPTRLHALNFAVQACAQADRLPEALHLADAMVELAWRNPCDHEDANAYSARGLLRLRSGDALGARDDLQRADRLYAEEVGLTHFLTVQNAQLLGHARLAAGDGAGLAQVRAATAQMALLRPRAIKHAQLLERQGLAEMQAGDPVTAAVTLRDAEMIWREQTALAPQHLDGCRLALARALALQGEVEAARAEVAALDTERATGVPLTPAHRRERRELQLLL